MIHFIKRDRWSPYFVGTMIGLLLTFLLSIGYKIGVSTGVARVAAVVANTVANSHVQSTPYFKALLADGVIFNWKILFVVGLFLGALLASKLSPKKDLPTNSIWVNRFGTSKWRRRCAAYLGGFLLLFGARLANGCTSGHAISGGAQLAVTSWVFMLTLFAVGIPTSMIIYNKKRST